MNTSGGTLFRTPVASRVNRFGDAPVPTAPTPRVNRFGDAPAAPVESALTQFAQQQQQANAETASVLTRGELLIREKGKSLQKIDNGDGTFTYVPTQTQPARSLPFTERQAVAEAYSRNYAGQPLGVDQAQDYGQYRADALADLAAANGPVGNFGNSTAATLGNWYAGMKGAVEGGDVAARIREDIANTYVHDTDSNAALGGQVAGNLITMAPAIATGGSTAGASVVAGMGAGSTFGNVRADVSQLRARGQNITVTRELTAAALAAIAEFAGEYVGGKVLKPINTADVGLAVAQYAKVAGINATEEMFNQVVQNAVASQVLNQDVALGEGVSRAIAVGGLSGAAARGIADARDYINRPPLPPAPQPLPPRQLPYIRPEEYPVQSPGSFTPPLAAEDRMSATVPYDMRQPPASNAIPVVPEPARELQSEPVQPVDVAAMPPLLRDAPMKLRVQDGPKSVGLPVEFTSAVDKALYIASQPRRGKLQIAANAWLQNLGMTADQVKIEAEAVRSQVETFAVAGDELVRVPALPRVQQSIPLAQLSTYQQQQGQIPVENVPANEQMRQPVRMQSPGYSSTQSAGITSPQPPAPAPAIPRNHEVQPYAFRSEQAINPRSTDRPLEVRSNPKQTVSPGGVHEGRGSEISAVATPPESDAQPGASDEVRQPAFLPGSDRVRAAVDDATRTVKGFRATAPRNAEQAKVRKAFRNRGVEVVYYDGEGRGFYDRSHPGVLFVNGKNAEAGLREAVVHEFVHELAASRPGLFNELMTSLTEQTRTDFQNWYAQAFQKMRPGQTPSRLSEEGVTTPYGRLARDGSVGKPGVAGEQTFFEQLATDRIWTAITGADPTIVQKVMDFFRQFAAKFSQGSRQLQAVVRALEATSNPQQPPASPDVASPAPTFLPYGHWIAPDGDMANVDYEGHAQFARARLGLRQAAPEAATNALLDQGWARVVNIAQKALDIETHKPLTREAIQALRPSVERVLDEHGEVRIEDSSLGYRTARITTLAAWNRFANEVMAQQASASAPRNLREAKGRRSSPSLPQTNFASTSFLPPIPAAARRGGGLPDEVVTRNDAREGEIAESTKRAGFNMRALADAIQDEMGMPARKLPPAEIEKLDLALKGRVPLSTLPPKVASAIQVMRDDVDAKTFDLMGTSLVDPVLMQLLGNNLGEYVNRSYRIFDDAKWAEKVPPRVMANAINFIQSQLAAAGKPASLQDAKIYVDELLADWKQGGVDALFSGAKLGSKNLAILKKRKDIAPEIRALMGEYNNAFTNYAKSIAKTATLVANHRFLEGVKADGMGNWLFTDDTAQDGFTTRIAAEGSASMAPLNGLRTSPEIAQAFADFNKSHELPGWARVLMTANFVAKSAKTVGSLMTQVRNLIGQPYFNLLNGHFRIGKYGQAAKATLADLTNRGDAGIQGYVTKLHRLGVLGQGVQARELLADIKDMGLADSDVYTESGWLPAIKRVSKGALDVAQKAYATSDHIGKVVGFENELARMKEAHPSLPLAEQERMAAERVLNTYPTYSRVPQSIRVLRRQPLVGPFISFWYESFRTMGNSIGYAYEDLKSNNTAQRRHGAERLVGLTAVAGGGIAASAISKALLGVSDEEEEAFRRFQPEWSKGNQFLFVGKDDEGNYRTIDISALNPYSPVVDAVHSVIAGEGKLTDRFAEAIGEFFRPLTGEQIFTKAVLDVSRNKKGDTGGRVYNPEDSTANQLQAVLGHLMESIEPGTVQRLRERIIPGMLGRESSFGDKLRPADEITAEVTGVKVRTFSFKNGLTYQGRKFSGQQGDITNLFLRELNRPGSMDADRVADAHRDMERRRFEAWQSMAMKAQGAVQAGLSKQEVFAALVSAGVQRETAKAVIRGVYVPYDIKGSAVREAAKQRPGQLPLPLMLETYREFAGRKLREDD